MVPNEPAGPVRLKPRRPCPICGKPSSHKLHPFCSARCADTDLHRWLGGTYAIPTEEPPQLDTEDGEAKADSEDSSS